MNKLWHCQLIYKEYICKFNILGPASGSRGGGHMFRGCMSSGAQGYWPPPYYAPDWVSNEIVRYLVIEQIKLALN